MKKPLYRLYFMLNGQRRYVGSTSVAYVENWEAWAKNAGATHIIIDPPLPRQEETEAITLSDAEQW